MGHGTWTPRRIRLASPLCVPQWSPPGGTRPGDDATRSRKLVILKRARGVVPGFSGPDGGEPTPIIRLHRCSCVATLATAPRRGGVFSRHTVVTSGPGAAPAGQATSRTDVVEDEFV